MAQLGRLVSRRRALWASLLFVAAATSCGDGLPPGHRQPAVAIVGAKLIDGSGGEPIKDTVIVIEGTRIRNAGRRSHTPVPKGGEIFDGQGKVVIPGLVDPDARYSGDRSAVEQSLRAQLEKGVVAAGARGLSQSFDRLLADLRGGRTPGPRIYALDDSPDGSPNGKNPTGWEVHDEIARMVAAGQPPVEALAVATRDNARLLAGDGAEFGIVAAGQIADLIVLEADPLEDIQQIRNIHRVMQAGQWVSGKVLDKSASR